MVGYRLDMKKLLLFFILVPAVFSQQAQRNGSFDKLNVRNTLTSSSLNKLIYVDGSTYALSASGIQAAINQAAANGGGTVILPPTNGTPVAMGTTSLNMSAKVFLKGAGYDATVLQWSGTTNAIVFASINSGGGVSDLHLDFTGASNASSAIRITAADGASQTSFLTVENIHITFVIPSSGNPTSTGIFASGSGPSGTDVVLNTFRNITVENANQMIVCTRCEGNFWQVRGQNLGTVAGANLVALTNSTNEIMDIRAEVGSSNFANEICFSDDATSQNNLVRIVCDNSLTGTAFADSGTYNIFDVTTIGASVTLGTVAATSQYRYSSSYTTTQTIKTGTIRATQQISDQGSVCTNGELALSAGWQSTGSATVTAVAGNGQTCSWTITTGTTTAANPTVTDTLTNALPAATTVCWMNIYGGTHTAVAGESLRQTTLSATAPVFTANFTPTAGGTTYFVTRSCGP